MTSLLLQINQKCLNNIAENQFPQTLQINNIAFFQKHQVTSKIASNRYITFFKGKHKRNRNQIFIKVVNKSKMINFMGLQEKQLKIKNLRLKSSERIPLKYKHILRFHQYFENDQFIIIIQQYAKITLQDRLSLKIRRNHKSSIQWIKQIIYGLAYLYQNNIYLKTIDLNNIYLINNKLRLNFCQKQKYTQLQIATLTKCQIIKNHIFAVGKIFYMMISGTGWMIELTDDKIQQIRQILLTKNMLFSKKLNPNVKSFLLQILCINSMQRPNWYRFISHQIFKNDTQQNNDKFLSLIRIFPQISYAQRDSIQFQILGQLQQLVSHESKYIFIALTKVEIIFEKIIKQLYDKQVFGLKHKQVFQIIYQLTIRCIRYLKQIKRAFTRQNNVLINNLIDEKYDELYYIILCRLTKYNSIMIQKQKERNKAMIVLKSIKSIIKLKWGNEKQQALINNEAQQNTRLIELIELNEYDQIEQINSTVNKINKFIQPLRFLYQSGHVYYYLKYYKEICNITFQDLGNNSFYQYLTTILNERQIIRV